MVTVYSFQFWCTFSVGLIVRKDSTNPNDPNRLVWFCCHCHRHCLCYVASADECFGEVTLIVIASTFLSRSLRFVGALSNGPVIVHLLLLSYRLYCILSSLHATGCLNSSSFLHGNLAKQFCEGESRAFFFFPFLFGWTWFFCPSDTHALLCCPGSTWWESQMGRTYLSSQHEGMLQESAKKIRPRNAVHIGVVFPPKVNLSFFGSAGWWHSGFSSQ